jgi:hypothetical protein
VIGNLFSLRWIDVDTFGKYSLRPPLRHHLEALAAAHALLQIMSPFLERVLDDGQHLIISFRVKNIAGADKNLDLIRFRPRLIEPFAHIVQVERYEIDDAPPGDPQPLPLLHFKRSAGILRHDLTLQDGHPDLPYTRLPSGAILSS